MGSNSIAHFDQNIDQNKNLNLLLDYVKKSFVNFDSWLATEPNPVPVWNIHWISGKMSRGEKQSWHDFQNQLITDASEYFWHCVKKQKYVMMVCNKIQLPVAYQNLKNITIINDAPSLKFVRKSVWYKHYGIKNNMVHIKINDPELYPEPTKTIMKQFNNPIYVNESIYKFYRNTVWDNSCTNFFSDTQNFNNINNLTVCLSDILCEQKITNVVNQITDYLNADRVNSDYIIKSHRYWLDLHQFNF